MGAVDVNTVQVQQEISGSDSHFTRGIFFFNKGSIKALFPEIQSF